VRQKREGGRKGSHARRRWESTLGWETQMREVGCVHMCGEECRCVPGAHQNGFTGNCPVRNRGSRRPAMRPLKKGVHPRQVTASRVTAASLTCPRRVHAVALTPTVSRHNQWLNRHSVVTRQTVGSIERRIRCGRRGVHRTCTSAVRKAARHQWVRHKRSPCPWYSAYV